MSEKEFLAAYVDYVIGNRSEDTEKVRKGHSKLIDQFLDNFHKQGYSIKFERTLMLDGIPIVFDKTDKPDLIVFDKETGKLLGVIEEDE